MPFNYKSYADLARDVAMGVQALPEFDLVVGVPKSGLIPATMIANFSNRELMDLDTFLFTHSKRSGARGSKGSAAATKTRVLLVDDSVNTGSQFAEIRARLSHFGEGYEFIFCAIYGVTEGAHDGIADFVFTNIAQPRFFQWNYRNHIIAEHALFDLDGVLCVDPTDDENDDSERYLEFIANARPLIIPPRKLSGIVTSRLERYREATEVWLKRHGVLYDELIMLDLPSAEERRRLRAHAPFKAEVFGMRDEVLFVESNWKQARDIARRADKPVICTENDILLYGAEHLADLERQGGLYDRETAATIDELRRQNCTLMLAAQNGRLRWSRRRKRARHPAFRRIRDFARQVFFNRKA